jgi:inorganic triphosphatase YgiF
MDGARGQFIETERKYEVNRAFTVPDLASVPGVSEVTAPQRFRLTAVYFDTSGLALNRAHITLRRRTGGEDAGWHLKLPAGPDSRREIHEPLGSSRGGVPPRLLAAIAACTGDQPVRPIAQLQTSRTVRRLLGRAGRALAEVADDRVTGSVPGAGIPDATGTAWQTVTTWREVEVELADGTSQLLDAVAQRLAGAGATPSRAASKLSIVLAAAGEGPEGEPAVREG